MCCHLHGGTKARAVETTGTSAYRTEAAPRWTGRRDVHMRASTPAHTRVKASNPVSPRTVLRSNPLILLNPNPLVWVLLIFFVVKWSLCINHVCSTSKHSDGLKEKAHAQLFVLQAELVTLLMECHFYLKEQLTNYGYSDLGIDRKSVV